MVAGRHAAVPSLLFEPDGRCHRAWNGRACDRTIDCDGPAYGCTACGLTWGRGGDEFADGG